MRAAVPLIVIVLVAGIAGCDTAITPAERACNAYLDTFADKAANECELGSYEEVRAAVMDQFTDLGVESCADFVAVDDEYEFYNECLPGIEAMTCEELDEALPDACNGQLLYQED